MRLAVIVTIHNFIGALECNISKRAVTHLSLFTNFSDINFSAFDFILLVSDFQKSCCRVITLPDTIHSQKWKEAIEMKFCPFLPEPSDKIYWGYRHALSSPHEQMRHFIAYAIDKDEIAILISKLQDLGIKADYFLPIDIFLTQDIFPYLSFPPTIENLQATVDKEEIMALEERIPALKNWPQKAKLIFFSIWTFLNTCPWHTKDFFQCSELQIRKLSPVRCKTLRLLSIIVLVILFFFTMGITWKQVHIFYSVYQNLRVSNIKSESELKRLQKLQLQRKLKLKLLKSYHDLHPGYLHLSSILCDITQKVPSNMWITSFRMSGDTITFSLVAQKADLELYNKFKSSSLYTIINLRQDKGINNQIQYNITLSLRS